MKETTFRKRCSKCKCMDVKLVSEPTEDDAERHKIVFRVFKCRNCNRTWKEPA